MAESFCTGEPDQENERQQHIKLVDRNRDDLSDNDLIDNIEALNEEIWNENNVGNRHSVDVTGLRDTCSSEAECQMASSLVSASKSEDDTQTKCKRKKNYLTKSGEYRRTGQQQHSSGLKQTVARVLGKSVPDQFRNFFELFSRSDTLDKDKQTNWRRAAQRKPRYKVSQFIEISKIRIYIYISAIRFKSGKIQIFRPNIRHD